MRAARNIIVGITALALTLSACGGGQKSSSNSADGTSGSIGPPSSANGAALMKINISCTPTLGLIPQAYEMANGIDKKDGVQLSCVQVQTGPQISALLISGAVNVTDFEPTNLYPLLSSGLKMAAFLPIQVGSGFDLLVRKGYPLPDASSGWQGAMKDLARARIGVPALGGAAQSIGDALFHEAGDSYGGVTYIATGSAPTTVAALSHGSIDAAVTYEPAISEALQSGIAEQPFSLLAGQGPAILSKSGGLMYVATQAWATSHQAALRDFVKAYEQGLAWMLNPANHAAVVSFVAQHLSVSPAVATQMLSHQSAEFTHATTIQSSAYDAEAQLYYNLGATKQVWTTSQYAFKLG